MKWHIAGVLKDALRRVQAIAATYGVAAACSVLLAAALLASAASFVGGLLCGVSLHQCAAAVRLVLFGW